MNSNDFSLRVACVAFLACASMSLAQRTVVVPDVAPQVDAGASKTERARKIEAQRQWNKRRFDAERELRLLRGTAFRETRDTAKREAGLTKLRGFTDPAAFAPMIDILADQRDDVLLTILDVFEASPSGLGEGSLAGAMLHFKSPTAQAAAATRLAARIASHGVLNSETRGVLDAAIRGSDDRARLAALEFIDNNNLVEFIPSLISGQTFTRNDDSGGDTASITTGTELTYVRSVRAVVAGNVVAFDPEIGYLNTGATMSVRNVFVIIRRVEVNAVLVKLTDTLTGEDQFPDQSMGSTRFGYDARAWTNWYQQKGMPMVKEALDARIAAAQTSRAATQAPAAAQTKPDAPKGK